MVKTHAPNYIYQLLWEAQIPSTFFPKGTVSWSCMIINVFIEGAAHTATLISHFEPRTSMFLRGLSNALDYPLSLHRWKSEDH